MKQRLLLWLSGAVGLVLAALFYFVALDIRGILRGLLMIPDLGIVIFLIVLAVSLFEIGVMIFVMIQFARHMPLAILGLIAAGYVSFAGVYAIGYAVFVREELGIQVLAGLAIVRWLTLLFVEPHRQTE